MSREEPPWLRARAEQATKARVTGVSLGREHSVQHEERRNHIARLGRIV